MLSRKRQFFAGFIGLWSFVFVPLIAVAGDEIVSIQADPKMVRISGPQAEFAILVHGKSKEGQVFDLTSKAKFQSLNPKIAKVDDRGVVRGIADGFTKVVVDVARRLSVVEVEVKETKEPRRFHFENDIEPIFARYGCNSSGCHGKAEGQNGFKLSVFGFDPLADHRALVSEARGRRLLFAAPEHSLLLMKATGQMAHGGGARLTAGSRDYETLRAWIAAGAPFGAADAPKVVSIELTPRERVMRMDAGQKLRVVATWSNGKQADVTALAKFQSNNDTMVTVNEEGLVTAGQTPGQAAVMAGFLGAVDTFRVLIPRNEKIATNANFPVKNFIDPLVYRQLDKLNIAPSAPANDDEFLRRVYLDVIGTLPTPAEARAFLQNKKKDRRKLLVEKLLNRPEYADYWALKWADLLSVNRQKLGHKLAYAYYRWIRENIANNTTYDKMVRELLTVEGSADKKGAANFYRVISRPGDRASTISQVFLGVRIACAECHHHPFDRWSQTDYYGMQSFFTPVAIRKTGRGEMIFSTGNPQSKHPRTKKAVYSYPLGTQMPEKYPDGDRRTALAKWLASGKNPWFARNLANRMWAHFLGRGIVEPVDDVRDTNPPTNPALLDALAKHVVDTKFDVKQLIRTIASSQVYQLSSKPNKTNAGDETNYSRALFRRISAEVMLDMVSQTTGVGERFQGMPPGYRAIQLWDSEVPHSFLKLFGRPVRVSACECERNVEASVSQVLHFLNSPKILKKLEHENGMVAGLVRTHMKNDELVDEMYLTFFSRFPTAAERKNAVNYLSRNTGQRRQAAEDLAWSMLNSLEFVFNH